MIPAELRDGLAHSDGIVRLGDVEDAGHVALNREQRGIRRGIDVHR